MILLRALFGAFLILVGFVMLFTPLTPGSWLIIPGLVLVIGRERTRLLARKIVGEKRYKKYNIDRFI